jgi:hypothetical protein
MLPPAVTAVGYFANPRQLPGKPRGAFFFGVRFRDILD